MKYKTIIKKYGVKEVAEETGVNLSTPYRWLKGTRTPNKDNLKELNKLAKRLEKHDITRKVKTTKTYQEAAKKYSIEDALLRMEQRKVKAKISLWDRFVNFILGGEL